LFSKYSQFDTLRHVTSRFIGRPSEWWQRRQSRVQKGRESCINTFYELKACIWKHFIPPSFRITREQQSRIENFIDVGDAFIKNLTKFSRQEKDFKNNLDLFLSKQRERERERERERNKREQEKSLRSSVLRKRKENKRNVRKMKRRKEMKKKRQKRRMLEKSKKGMRGKNLKKER